MSRKLVCVAAVAALVCAATGISKAVPPNLLWNHGTQALVIFNGAATNLGYSSGTPLTATALQRWATQPFRVNGTQEVVITEVWVNYFEPAGFQGATIDYKIFSRTPLDANDTFAINNPPNSTGVVVSTGTLGAFESIGVDDPDFVGADTFMHIYKNLCIHLQPGDYWFTMYPIGLGPNNTAGFHNAAWFTGAMGGDENLEHPQNDPFCALPPAIACPNGMMWRSNTWPAPGFAKYTGGGAVLPNGAQDPQDIYNTSFRLWGFAVSGNDCNSNGISDECESDCNNNALPDECDIAGPTSTDCNNDTTPDECQPGALDDCNSNGTGDACEEGFADCNGNATADFCDIALPTASSPDCDGNGAPDECQADCDEDGAIDACEIAGGAPDCNTNGVPDGCELIAETYSVEDGTADNSIGFGVAELDVIWTNKFTVEAGAEMISGVSLAWGSIANGLPCSVMLISDPNQDGSPVDGLSLAFKGTIVADANQSIFKQVFFDTPVNVGPAGTIFHVGCVITLTSGFPCPIDQTDPDVALTSYIQGTTPAGGQDPAAPELQFLAPIEPGFPGNWLLRAMKTIYLNDANGNGTLDVCEEQPVELVDCPGGDMNDDGDHDGADVAGIVDVLVGNVTDPSQRCRVDVTGDGVIDGLDLDRLITNVLDPAPYSDDSLVAFNVGGHVCSVKKTIISKAGAAGKTIIVRGKQEGVDSDCDVEIVQLDADGVEVAGTAATLTAGESCYVTVGANQKVQVRCAAGTGNCLISYKDPSKAPPAGSQTCP